MTNTSATPASLDMVSLDIASLILPPVRPWRSSSARRAPGSRQREQVDEGPRAALEGDRFGRESRGFVLELVERVVDEGTLLSREARVELEELPAKQDHHLGHEIPVTV